MCYRLIAGLLLICITAMTAGCFGARETDEIAYVLAIGIDQAEEGKICVTYQIAIPKSLGGSGGGGGGGGQDGKPTMLVSVKATSLASARNLLNSSVARVPNLTQAKVIILGEKLARQGVDKALAPAMRFREFRGSMYVLVINQMTAREFMEKNIPRIEILPSRYYETMMLSSKESAYFISSNLYELYSALKSNSEAPVVTLWGINPLDGGDRFSNAAISGGAEPEYIAGNMPRVGASDPAEAAGMAVFNQGKMVGTLTTGETRVLAMLRGKYPESFLVVQDPLVPDSPVNLMVRLGRSPRIHVTLSDGRPVITASVFLEAEISGLPSGVQYESAEWGYRLEDQVSSVIKQTADRMIEKTQIWGADVVGFGYMARTLYPTYQDFIQSDWDELYRQSTVQISVTTKIRRTGLMLKTSPLRMSEQ